MKITYITKKNLKKICEKLGILLKFFEEFFWENQKYSF